MYKTVLIAFCFFPFLLLSTHCFCQIQNTFFKKAPYQIKINPIKLVSTHRGLSIGFEKTTKNNNSILLTGLAFINPFIFLENKLLFPRAYSNIKGFGFSIENKFFTKSKPFFGIFNYWSLNYSLENYSYNKVDWFKSISLKDSLDKPLLYLDSVHVKKMRQLVSVKFGYQEKMKKIVWETAIGIGVGIRRNLYSNKVNPNDELTSTNRHTGFIDDPEGKRFIFRFPFDFKVGILF